MDRMKEVEEYLWDDLVHTVDKFKNLIPQIRPYLDHAKICQMTFWKLDPNLAGKPECTCGLDRILHALDNLR